MIRNRNLLILLIGVFMSELAVWIGTIGSLQFLSEQLSSRFLQALILVSGALLGIGFAPYAGKMIDRLNPKVTLLFSSSLRIAAVLTMLIAIEKQSIAFMIVFQLILALASAFYFPTVNTVIPRIVSEEHLLRANMLNFNLTTVARIFGTAVGGLLLSTTSLKEVFLLSGATYCLLTLMTACLQIPSNTAHGQISTRPKVTFVELFPLMKQQPIIGSLLLMTGIPFLFIGSFNLLAIEISEFHTLDSLKGVIYTLEGVSILLAGVLLKRLTSSWGKWRILLCGAVLVIISMLLLMIPMMSVQVIAFAIFGFASGLFIPLSNMEAQVRITKDVLGRFFSFKRMIETTVIQFSLIATGALLDIFSLSTVMACYGTLSLIVLVLAISKNKAYLATI